MENSPKTAGVPGKLGKLRDLSKFSPKMEGLPEGVYLLTLNISTLWWTGETENLIKTVRQDNLSRPPPQILPPRRLPGASEEASKGVA